MIIPILALQQSMAGLQLAIGCGEAHHSCRIMRSREVAKRVELGNFIVADSRICGGQPTFKGTRIMVWLVLEQIEDGMTWDQIVKEWEGKSPKKRLLKRLPLLISS